MTSYTASSITKVEDRANSIADRVRDDRLKNMTVTAILPAGKGRGGTTEAVSQLDRQE